MNLNRISDFQTNGLLEDLLYALCGFDTSRIYVEDESLQVMVSDGQSFLIEPFKFLIIKIREFYNDKRFNPFISKYLIKVATLKPRTIEELILQLQEDFEMFLDLNKYNNNEPINKNGEVYKYFRLQNREVISKAIDQWINYGIPGNMINIDSASTFTNCFWNDYFAMGPVDLPKEEIKGIEVCGKIIFFIRLYFGVEIINDSSLESKEEVFYEKLLKRKGVLGSPHKKINSEGYIDFKECEGIKTGITNLLQSSKLRVNNKFDECDFTPTEFHKIAVYKSLLDDSYLKIRTIRPYNYNMDCGEIIHRKNELLSILNGMISEKINLESKAINSIVFLQDMNVFANFFDKFSSELFLSTKNDPDVFGSKINKLLDDRSFAKFALDDFDLSEYVLKLLKYSKIPQNNEFLINLQRITVFFEDGILKYFFSEKFFVELKIIFRFLFAVNSLIYFFERSKKYNFARVIYLILMKVKSNAITTIFLGEGSSQGIDEFVLAYNKQVNHLLVLFDLTNSSVFRYWSMLLSIGYEYLQMEYKENVDVGSYNSKVYEAVSGLYKEILLNSGENEMSEFLKNLEISKYLG